MKFKKTTKLFFDKYLYKVSLFTPIAEMFRCKKIDLIKEELQSYDDKFSKQNRNFISIPRIYLKQINKDEFYAMLEVINLLENFDEEFNTRIEGKILSFYSNNEQLIDNISNVTGIKVREVYKPLDKKIADFLMENHRVVIRTNYTHKYKVHISGLKKEADNFVIWAQKLSKVKLTSNDYRWESYFYVQDEKTLSMCRLFLGNKVKKVEKLYTVSEIS